MTNLIERGTFVARNERWYYSKITKADMPHLLPYLIKYAHLHNDGSVPTLETLEEKFEDGFYDHSYIIKDSNGIVNSAAVLWDLQYAQADFGDETPLEVLTCWSSGLYLEERRSSVCPVFIISLWFNVYGGSFIFYETKLDFVTNMFNDFGFNPMRLKDGKDDWVVNKWNISEEDAVMNLYNLEEIIDEQ